MTKMMKMMKMTTMLQNYKNKILIYFQIFPFFFVLFAFFFLTSYGILFYFLVNRSSETAEILTAHLNFCLSDGYINLKEEEQSSKSSNIEIIRVQKNYVLQVNTETADITITLTDEMQEELTRNMSIKTNLENIMEDFKNPEYRQKFMSHPLMDKAIMNLQKSFELSKQDNIDPKTFLIVAFVTIGLSIAGGYYIHYSFKNEIMSFLNSLNLNKNDMSSIADQEKAIKNFIKSCFETQIALLKEELSALKQESIPVGKILVGQKGIFDQDQKLFKLTMSRFSVFDARITNLEGAIQNLDSLVLNLETLLNIQEKILKSVAAKKEESFDKNDIIISIVSEIFDMLKSKKK